MCVCVSVRRGLAADIPAGQVCQLVALVYNGVCVIVCVGGEGGDTQRDIYYTRQHTRIPLMVGNTYMHSFTTRKRCT